MSKTSETRIRRLKKKAIGLILSTYPLGNSQAYNHRVQRWATRHPDVWPHITAIQFAQFRVLLWTLERLGIYKLTTFKGAFDDLKFEFLRQRRNTYLEMDRLELVSRGLQELGLKSTLEAHVANVSEIQSSLTHPNQRPGQFYVPGLPATPWYELSQFDWVKRLEAAHPAIRREAMALLDETHTRFRPYPNTIAKDLKSFPFFLIGKKVTANCERCPETTKLLESIPRLFKYHIMFGLLDPGGRVTEHCGMSNMFVRSHLGVKVADGCWLRVNGEKRYLREGAVVGAFDESFEHDAANEGSELRLVLYIDVWNPLLSDADIQIIEATSMLDAGTALVRRWSESFS